MKRSIRLLQGLLLAGFSADPLLQRWERNQSPSARLQLARWIATSPNVLSGWLSPDPEYMRVRAELEAVTAWLKGDAPRHALSGFVAGNPDDAALVTKANEFLSIAGE